ncbi:hypothetical protein Sjap_025347 [Stephania japonica]|uniref:Uncharacterized protein n=1 Tax=Stephania japonica TaxID=461633 RepID=A0AAP0E1M9_9MAGN
MLSLVVSSTLLDSRSVDYPLVSRSVDNARYRDDVEVLLNEKVKGKNKFNFKISCDQMMDYVKKLKLCIKWFQEMEESYILERERLWTMLKSSEKRISETEAQMRYRTDELDLELAELSRTHTFLEEKLAKLESEKMMAFDSHRNEKEVRVALERTQASLAEALERTEQGLNRANQKIESLNASYRNSQDYNTGLQQYNSKLQRDSDSYKASLERLGQEKSVIIETIAMLQGKYGMLQDELSSFQVKKVMAGDSRGDEDELGSN